MFILLYMNVRSTYCNNLSSESRVLAKYGCFIQRPGHFIETKEKFAGIWVWRSYISLHREYISSADERKIWATQVQGRNTCTASVPHDTSNNIYFSPDYKCNCILHCIFFTLLYCLTRHMHTFLFLYLFLWICAQYFIPANVMIYHLVLFLYVLSVYILVYCL